MSRKREDAPKKGAPAWTATFGDLMNLLLCFFVMLFAMSSIDVQKYEQIRNSFNSDYTSILSGGKSVMSNSDTGETISILDSQKISDDTGNHEHEDTKNTQDQEKTDKNDETNAETNSMKKTDELLESMETINAQKAEYSKKMYEEVKEMISDQKIDEGMVDLSMDADNDYVCMTLSGSLLFDSGETDLNEEAKPVLSKVGDILKMFAGYQIEIVGHTDNVPVTTNHLRYRDNNELSSDRALSTFYYLVNEKGIDPATLKYSGRGEYDPVTSNKTAKGRQQNRRVEIKIYNQLSRY